MATDNIPQPGRPFDALGPATDPVAFSEPRFHFGTRADVLCYNAETDQHEVFKEVLFRDLSRSPITDADDPNDRRIHEAYWKIPDKPTMGTIMGHIVICLVLEPWRRQQSGDGNQSDSDDRSIDSEPDVVYQTTNRLVAIKVNYRQRIDAYRGRHAENPITEIAAMQLIGDRHPNVLGCRQVLQDEENIYVVMRYCDSSDMFELLQNQLKIGQPFLEGQTRYWFRQLIAGVKYLHSLGICHRDLSPENVMIDRQTDCVVIDMGMCLRVPYTTTQPGANVVMDIFEAIEMARIQGSAPLRCRITPQGPCGKYPYMSPEIYRNRDNFDGEAIDVWTCGTILFCLFTGIRPYELPHPSDRQYIWVTRRLPRLLQDWGIQLSDEGLHLLRNMLQVLPRLRLTLDEIENHPWFAFPDELPDMANL